MSPVITAGVFALAAAITRQPLAIGLTAIFLLLTIQAAHAALVQLNYLNGRFLCSSANRNYARPT